jgi:hypothetical protein
LRGLERRNGPPLQVTVGESGERIPPVGSAAGRSKTQRRAKALPRVRIRGVLRTGIRIATSWRDRLLFW